MFRKNGVDGLTIYSLFVKVPPCTIIDDILLLVIVVPFSTSRFLHKNPDQSVVNSTGFIPSFLLFCVCLVYTSFFTR